MISPTYHAIRCAPINSDAYRVASQKGCVDEFNITKDEFKEKYRQLVARRLVLSFELGATTATKRKNLKGRLKKGAITMGSDCPSVLREYLELGDKLSKMSHGLSEYEAERKENHKYRMMVCK
jgi:hypothetical protein